MTKEEFLLFKATYLATRDPTEYTASLRFTRGYVEWMELVNREDIKPIITKWREEMTAQLRSESYGRILDTARGDTKDSLMANKYIYESLAEDKDKKQVGRPSKEAILKEAHKMLSDDQKREEAYNRLIINEAL